MMTDSLMYTYICRAVSHLQFRMRNARILACIMSVRMLIYACMRNANVCVHSGGHRTFPDPHNSLSDRPPEIYVPTPLLDGSMSSFYIHTHVQVLGVRCNTTSIYEPRYLGTESFGLEGIRLKRGTFSYFNNFKT